MKIKFNANPEQLELIKAMGSKDRAVAEPAQLAFAQLMGPVLNHVYQQADTTKAFYTDWAFDPEDDPSLPLELFSRVGKGYFSITQQNLPGGLATNTVHQPIDEVKFQTYRLDSTVSFLQKYAKKMRLPIIAKAMERLLQEVLLKTNLAAWNVILAALAAASHSVTINAVTSTSHVFASQTAGEFTLEDLNRLLTYFRRLGASWNGGSPADGANKPTDLVLSPEIMQQLRSMAYNPINTRGGNRTAITANSQQSAGAVVALSDEQRSALFSSAGVPEFYGISITELLELGPSQDYQTLFSEYIGGTTLPYIGTSGSSVTYNSATQNLILVLDSSREAGIRPLATDPETNSAFNLEPDDQWVKRSEKIGYYGHISEARVFLDSRAIAGLVV